MQNGGNERIASTIIVVMFTVIFLFIMCYLVPLSMVDSMVPGADEVNSGYEMVGFLLIIAADFALRIVLIFGIIFSLTWAVSAMYISRRNRDSVIKSVRVINTVMFWLNTLILLVCVFVIINGTFNII